MFSGPKKPYTAVTVQIEHLTSEQYEVDDFSGIVDLIEVVRVQDSGPTEAARALRKKLKYGSVHRQLRALTILDGLIQNAGTHFQRTCGDEPLLERLRVAATDPISDQAVKEKCAQLFAQWNHSYSKTPGLERIAALYKELPKRKKPRPQQQSKVLRETEAEANEEEPPSSPGAASRLTSVSSASSSSSRPVTLSAGPNLSGSSRPWKKDKKDKSKKLGFNLEKEKPQMLQTIASSSVASTNLMNALKLINRESRRVSEDPEAVKRFETCKQLRRQILRYIQYVESEQWLGSLIHSNEELVNALMAFEVLDKSVDDDSDSEEEETWSPGGGNRSRAASGAAEGVAGLSLGGNRPPQPRRSSKPVMYTPLPPAQHSVSKQKATDFSDEEEDEDEENENDPFADRNAVTPGVEPKSMKWA